jgi:hypothetical protein
MVLGLLLLLLLLLMIMVVARGDVTCEQILDNNNL